MEDCNVLYHPSFSLSYAWCYVYRIKCEMNETVMPNLSFWKRYDLGHRNVSLDDNTKGQGWRLRNGNAFTCSIPVSHICPGCFPSSLPVHAGIVTLNRVGKSQRWVDYRLAVRVRLNSDEPCCALVSVKHHLITGCVFIIIIIVIIIISLLPSLKSETMGSLKRLLLNWSSLASAASAGS